MTQVDKGRTDASLRLTGGGHQYFGNCAPAQNVRGLEQKFSVRLLK